VPRGGTGDRQELPGSQALSWRQGPGFWRQLLQKDILNLVYHLPVLPGWRRWPVTGSRWLSSTTATARIAAGGSSPAVSAGQRQSGSPYWALASRPTPTTTRAAARHSHWPDLLEGKGAHLAIHDPKVSSSQISADLQLPECASGGDPALGRG